MKKFLTAKVGLSVLSVFLLIAGVVAGVQLVRQPQLFEQDAAPATTLELRASNENPAVNEEFTVDVYINTGGNAVIGSELYISFDNSNIEVLGIAKGDFLSAAEEQTRTVDNSSRRVTYILFLTTQSTAVSGSGVLATMNVRALQSGSTTLSFTSDTLVAAVGEDVGQNVLANGISETVNVASVVEETPTPTTGVGTGDLTNTPTTTPVPTNSPTPNPTSSSTPTPTTGSGGGSTATPSPSPTRVPSNTSTPTIRKTSGTPNPTSAALTTTPSVTQKPTQEAKPTQSPVTPTPFIKPRHLAGDANRDDRVGFRDLLSVVTKIGRTADWDADADVNRDGKVNLRDFRIVISNLFRRR